MELVILVKIFIININPKETTGRKHFEKAEPFSATIPYTITTIIHNRVSIPLKAEKELITILISVVVSINPIKHKLSLNPLNLDE